MKYGSLSGMANGMLTRQELAREAKAGRIDTVLLGFTDHYGRLMGKRLDAGYFLESDGIHACDYLLTVDMEMDPVPGYTFANWEKGYGDVLLVPDLATLRLATWLPKTAMVLCDVLDEKKRQPVDVAPRSILKRQIEKARRPVMAASELEYYLFQNSYRDAAAKQYRGLEPAGWYLEDYHALQGAREEAFNGAARRHLRDSGVPVENSKGEWGLGQHELNVRYSDALTMADRHVVFKQCLKELADQMGISVTFMAKFAANQAGSSCHIHMSLPKWNEDQFRWFLGGWMARVPDVMVFYAPTINSYKRYQSGSWAPTRLAWSHDNRTGGFRVVGEGKSLRIECRIPGADCNPYLAYAAAIASGMDGIRRKTEPPPAFEGDIYQAQKLPQVPRTLRDALGHFENSEFAREAFGESVVAHYAHFFRTEQEAFDKAVTDWERQRYFERI
jgi:glutamine synthetase